ncbi:hypothetical protein C8J57DRAFT_1723351 [Mycena rebaudengoi]|nr:hypothetical protein C8J57DRAFT_1723351 [Mycena rebaudengoi]
MDAPSSDADDPPVPPADAPATTLTTKAAHWTFKDEQILLKHLIDNKASPEPGGGFKMTFFHSAVPKVNKSVSRGAAKTAKSCHGKFASLKKIFRIVQDIQQQSGFHWSNDTGASIDVASSPAWEAYLKRAPNAKQFRNKGWRHLSHLEQLMPAIAKGANVFRAGQAAADRSQEDSDDGEGDEDDDNEEEERGEAPAAAPRRSSPLWDIEHEHAPLLRDDNDLDVTATPAPRDQRKRSASSTPYLQRKQPRLSGGARALEQLAHTASDFNEIFTGIGASLAAATAAAAPVAGASAAPVAPVAVETGFQTTPHRKRDAIKRAQQLEKWLGVPKLIAFIELLRQDVSLVDTMGPGPGG